LIGRGVAPAVAALCMSSLGFGLIFGRILAAILVGLATGSEISEIAYIVSRYFGQKAFGLIYGSMFAAFQVGSAVGAYAMGRYYDQAGNYLEALWVVSALVAVGIVLMLMLGRYPDLSAESAGAGLAQGARRHKSR
jgi:predicted MFS family arabinose efflux permease